MIAAGMIPDVDDDGDGDDDTTAQLLTMMSYRIDVLLRGCRAKLKLWI